MFGISYWFLPIFAGCTWLGTLLAMLGRWIAIGSPHYTTMNDTQHIAYISDIGATPWGKPLFIAGSAVTVVVFNLAFLSERWLRHKGRLARNYNWTEKILNICALIAAIAGACGLILLTIFDTKRYPNIHVAMLCLFIGGYIVSAIFICAEYQRLGIHYRQYSILAASFWIKLAFIFIEVALVIAFGIMSNQSHWNRAAVLEWTISLVYIFYVWSFFIDFLPAVKTKDPEDRYVHPKVLAEHDVNRASTEQGGNLMGGPVYTSGGVGGTGESYQMRENGLRPVAQNF
ncbi:unnamed protein product [Zymoseptoria tritici ST99CH_3D1]|nr:unnamed protein product [Zymoseptoria tritici ST99CH_3D1]